MPQIDYYQYGVLFPDVHGDLVGNIKSVASLARIPELSVYTPIKGVCGEAEVVWLTSYYQHTDDVCGGLVLTGIGGDISSHLFGMAGGLIRNFIQPRVMTTQEVLKLYKDGRAGTDYTVILVPNFFLGKTKGGDIASWQISTLLGMLLERYAAGLKTVLYVQDMQGLKVAYGDLIYQHITNHFKIVGL